MNVDVTALKIREMQEMLRGGQISAVELTKEFLTRIAEHDGNVKSYITLTQEKALDGANSAQAKLDKGEASPLCGIPLGIKDNICTDGIRTTCASKILEDFVPPYNATVMEKLGGAGAILLGKLSMDEFAMGGSTQTSAFAKTRNPYDLGRVPGGSSGGSAAAVSANFCAGALGSDTGGSIRQPAAFCGVTGLKPTYGRVSRYGLVAFASSLDQIGPIAKDAHDCGIILNAIAGYDRHDGTSSRHETMDFTSKIGQSMKGMRVAIPREFFEKGIDDEVKMAVLFAAEKYKALGAQLVTCSMPSLKYAVAAYYLISSAEASSNLSRFDGIKYGHRSDKGDSFSALISNSRSEGFGLEVKRRILLGCYALSSGYYDAYYGKALALRQRIVKEYNDIFEKCDVILTPTTPSVAFKADESITDPVKMYQADICTVTANIASLPAISTTCGYDKNGLPIGMSIVGKAFDEATIIAVADAYERDFEVIAPILK